MRKYYKFFIFLFIGVPLWINAQVPLKSYNQDFLRNYGHIRCYSMEYDDIIQNKKKHKVGSEERERQIRQWVEKYKKEQASNTERRSSIFYIPVVVHVVHNGEAIGTGRNISAAQVRSQIDVLNEDFRKLAGSRGFNTNPVGADTEIEFVLAKRRSDGTAFAVGEEGINRVNGSALGWPAVPVTYDVFGNPNTNFVNNTIKPATIWTPTEYMNIWTVDMSGGGLLGYAQFPEDSGLELGVGGGDCASTANTDGFVVRYDAFGSRDKEATYGSTFTLWTGVAEYGRTSTHEIGHFLGLRHIWGDAGCGNDYCDDTPTHAGANGGCPTHPKSNACGTTDEMFENYMDYSSDFCMNIFTQDQKTRMRAVLENSTRRREWTNSPALIPPSTNFGSLINIISPTADICSATPTPVVTIRNMGSNTLTSMVISYQVDGGAVQTFNWTGSIAATATANINMPAITVAAGDHTYRAFVSSSNGAANTATPGQNDLTFSFTYSVNGTTLPFVENFDGNIFPPKNWQINQVGGVDCATWTQRTDITGSTGTLTSAAFMNHFVYDPATNQEDELITPVLDLTTATASAQLAFDVAYRRYDNTTNERLRVFISTDCGATWVASPIFDKAGTTLATLANSTATFRPSASGDWRNEVISLSGYAGQSIRLKFVSSNQFGNNIYVDNVRVTDRPLVSFVSATTANTENSGSGTTDCRGYQDINITLAISAAPTANAVVNFTLSGTANNGADYILNASTVTFPSGSTANQNLSVRIYNDQAIESLETAIITINTVTNATADPTKNVNTISITDNDTAPVAANAGGTLLSENFEGTVTGWSLYTTAGAVNVWRIGTQRVLNGTNSAYISQSAASGNYNNTTGAAILQTPVINATTYTTNSLQVAFNFQCNGERVGATDYDYGSLYYALAASPTTWVLIEGANPSPYRGVTTTTSRTVNLPAVLQGQQFHLAWRWDNDNSTQNQPAFVIDNIVVSALAITGTPIQTATFTAPATAQQVYLGPNSTVFAYNPANGNLIARIENTSSHDYGCTQIYVDRAGTSASQITTTATAEYLASKTIRVIPTNNNPTGAYNIRIYYTNAEVTGWETATSQVRTSAVINKTSGAISTAIIGTVSTAGSPTTQGTYGSDFWIEGGFANGFSGLGMGLPPGALPVKLASLQAIAEDNRIRVAWKTASEININNFVVEKSLDGKEFFAIGSIDASNNGSYVLYDNQPKMGENYYRLKIVETDNKYYFSNLVSANWGVGTTINAYPNPASDKLNLEITSFEDAQVQYRLVSSLGQVVLQGSQELSNRRSKTQELDVKGLAKGVYILEVNNGKMSQQIKIVIQ